MSTTRVKSPTSRLRLGHARHDITPPVGIYHRMWGAARHDAATGVHRPLLVDIVALEPLEANIARRTIRVQLDFVHLSNEQRDRLIAPVAEAAGVEAEQVIITHAHSHSAGFFEANRRNLPGGELIDGYLETVGEKAATTAAKAVSSLAPATISYAMGQCSMAANRDYWDEKNKLYATGYNPDRAVENALVVGRVVDDEQALRLVFVNYACHPTTLAWENTLLSPDFIGALREVVEVDQEVPCCFYQAPCGDLGPKEGFVGDTAVADKNGKQVGHAALSALYSLGQAQTDFVYAGPVVSGATIGTWQWQPHDAARGQETARFAGGTYAVELDMIDLQTVAELERELQQFSAEQAAADARGDAIAARDWGARAERCRRWLGRIDKLPAGKSFALHFSVHQLGDALWITTSAEPYSWLADELRRRFPAMTLVISPISGDTQVAYLLQQDCYGKGLYQEEPSALAPGCLEKLAEAISARIDEILAQTAV